MARWRLNAHYQNFDAKAHAQAEAEAKKRGGMSFEEMEEYVDRTFIEMASEKEDPESSTKDMRYLRIADQSAKSHKRIAEKKLQQGDTSLRHRAKALELAERKVVLLEMKTEDTKQATGNKTLSAEERARRVREILQ